MADPAIEPGKGRGTGPFRFPCKEAIALLLLSVLLAGYVLYRQHQPVVHAIDGYTMGSTWSVRFVGLRDVDVGAVRSTLELELEELNHQLSGYQPDTALSAFNRSPVGEWQSPPSHLRAVLDFGLLAHEETAGAFEMTIRPLVGLWGFGAAEPRTTAPSEAEIAGTVARIGSRFLERSPDGLQWRRNADVGVDVDAIAPGYAADVLSRKLASMGHPAHLVEIGGELVARGLRPDGTPWRVGIERPVPQRGVVEQVIAVSDVAIATSGDYRDYFEEDGVRYSHTLDPLTGRPVRHSLASVTVLAPTGMAADAYATALMVLGPERGLAFAQEHGLGIYLLLREGSGFREVYNDRFRPYLVDPGEAR